MVDILLIQPPIRDFYLTQKRTIPYGLAAIAAVLIDHGFSVDILDALATAKSRPADLPEPMHYLTEYYGRPDVSPFALFHRFRHFGYSYQHIGETVRRSGAFLVGISSLFTAYSDEAVRTAEIVKARLPECRTVVGGHHPTALPHDLMKSRAIDFVLRGEGEVSMARLARAVQNGRPVADIPGIVFRNKDGTLKTRAPAVMDDLDKFPPPAVHLVNHRFYRRRKRASAVVVTSRGCPFNCSYCCVGASSGSRYRRRSIASVLQEIETARIDHGAGFIDFEDENISLHKPWFLSLLSGIQSRFGSGDLELRAMNGLFPPTLDHEVVPAMKAAGFKTLNLSLGSSVAGQVRRFRRPNVTRAFATAVSLAARHRMGAVGYIIAGAPGQTAEDSLQDLWFLAGQNILAGLSVYYPAPGSADFTLCRDLGVLPPANMLMRSTALPVSHATSRIELVTLLRLARILNFMKSRPERGGPSLSAAALKPIAPDLQKDRTALGIRLVQAFLNDGRIRGVTPDGQVYEHRIDLRLSRRFINGLQKCRIRSAGN